MSNLQLEYVLDSCDRTCNITGNVMLKLCNTETGQVIDVSVVPCTLPALRIAIEQLAEEHGDVHILTDHSSIHCYEHIHAVMQKEIDAIRALEAETKAKWEAEEKTKLAEHLLDVLSTQSFESFYNDTYMDYIEGEEGCKTKEEMLAIIVRKFYR